MNTRFIGWAVALVAVVALGVALLLPRSSAAQDQTTDSRKRITVVGHGEVKVAPDVARVTIGVQSEGKDAASALADNNARMAATSVSTAARMAATSVSMKLSTVSSAAAVASPD